MPAMALTHDGLQTPLAPNRLWQLIGFAVLAAGIGWCVYSARGAWLCPAISVVVLGVLMVANQVRGVTRVRVTFSKLLVEDERPVMGFLIGPSKRRIPWEELESVDAVGGKVVAKGKSTTLELGEGSPEPELQDLVRKIKDAAARYAIESEDQKPS
jgi:hypothetical protein